MSGGGSNPDFLPVSLASMLKHEQLQGCGSHHVCHICEHSRVRVDRRASVKPVTDSSLNKVDVVGVGNAMVDVIVTSTDEFLSEQQLTKGAMALIDEDRANALYEMVGSEGIEASGGSAANTMAGIASFGGTSSYIGKVSDDTLGKVFAEDMRSQGVIFDQPPASEGPSTGVCVVLVTPDAQRTLNTYLGVSSLLEPQDIRSNAVTRAKILFCEGYLWDVESAKQAIRKAMDISVSNGDRVALTLSDTFCIERHHAEFLELVQGPVEILFANEAEIKTLYGCELEEAVTKAAADVGLACITLGKDGSVLASGSERFEIAPEQLGPVVDSTGAGDQYAAGVLFGLSQELPLAEVGRLGSLAAAEVISHIGPRPHQPLSELR